MTGDAKLGTKASLASVGATVPEPSLQTQRQTVYHKDSFRQLVRYTKRFQRGVLKHQCHVRLRTCHLKYRRAVNHRTR